MNKILLCILDGFGYCESKYGNAVTEAKFINNLIKNKKTLLEASGKYVGINDNQCGNSEVGHLTIGSGRVLKQKLPLINESIKSGKLEKRIIESKKLISESNTVHLMGLFSKGYIHSDINHYFWAIKLLRKLNIKIKAHLFLDGRDVNYRDAINTLAKALENKDINLNEIATIQGRYWAMDRDNRLERTEKAFNAIINAKSEFITSNIIEIIQDFYNKNINDETIPPIVMNHYSGAQKRDVFWMLNYRTDRIKQILKMISNNNYKLINMVPISAEVDNNSYILFNQENIINTLGEIISNNNLKQLRIAETEKYAHVTYFFNGGKEIQYPGENRILVPSPKVTNYVETPDMSSLSITSEIIKAIEESKYQVIIANFASPDMIGHTGNFEAAKEAIKRLDSHMQKILQVAKNNNFITIISADHGNAENMINTDGTPQKTHTCNKVPFIIVPNIYSCRTSGELADIAPTILDLLNIPQPSEMSGNSLLIH